MELGTKHLPRTGTHPRRLVSICLGSHEHLQFTPPSVVRVYHRVHHLRCPPSLCRVDHLFSEGPLPQPGNSPHSHFQTSETTKTGSQGCPSLLSGRPYPGTHGSSPSPRHRVEKVGYDWGDGPGSTTTGSHPVTVGVFEFGDGGSEDRRILRTRWGFLVLCDDSW